MRTLIGMIALVALFASAPARAEDGYDLWLRYRPLPVARAAAVKQHLRAIVPLDDTQVIRSAVTELQRAATGLTGNTPAASRQAGAVILALTGNPALRTLGVKTAGLGEEGYRIRSTQLDGVPVTVIAANGERGLLYGAFALIRRAQTGGSLDALDIASAPKLKLRVLDHWDNLDGVVERGYAGQSLWDWWTLPDYKDPRYTDYARADASIGINGVVLNNVNAKSDSLTAPYLAKTSALADLFRPWGLRVYLSARFTAPMEIGGLPTADPKNPRVIAWWRDKADEIYRLIPDFGGFLVKANSEGQPGPRDYGRTQAEGANLLAGALAPHGGVVMWRAFVYAETNPEDRAKQAYTEFKPLDGAFAANVIVQVKNGAIDFQPREPFHPLFGAMPRTPLMAEFQITKEYLGFATHLVYLGPLFSETLQSDTMVRGRGSTVARILDGSLERHTLTGIAGVANVGRDRDWTGSTFNQANWFAFGQLAWDPGASPEEIAREWAAMTFGPSPGVVETSVRMMMGSREAAVDYMTPLGLAHLMATGHHYGPAPWVADLARPEWNPVYYHRADATGIGFDRTATGSDAVSQYAPALARILADPARVPERNLLWFHHVPWDRRLASGNTLWVELVDHYDRGVAYVEAMQRQWASLAGQIDAERFDKTAAFLAVQVREAHWWRDASLAYWMSLNGLPLPNGSPAPAHDLRWYQAQTFPHAPGNPQ